MRLFARENSNSEELLVALQRMNEQLGGRQLTFDFKLDEDGWVAGCREFNGIVTGGTNKNPSQEEIMQSLIDAVKTAFHIPITKLEIKNTELYKLPKIEVVREFQLA